MKSFFGLFKFKRGGDLVSILIVCAIVFVFYKILSWGGVQRVMLVFNLLLFLGVGVFGYILYIMLQNPDARKRFSESRKAYMRGELGTEDEPEIVPALDDELIIVEEKKVSVIDKKTGEIVSEENEVSEKDIGRSDIFLGKK